MNRALGCSLAVVFTLLVLVGLHERGVHGQATTVGLNPSTIMAGNGSPVVLGIPCNLGIASNKATALFDDQSISVGNAVWKCKLQSDGVSYAWVAPFISPFQGTATSAAITPPTVVGCQTATVPVTGATTSMAATAAPIGNPGTGQINSTAYVSAPGVVTVTLCLPLTLVYTANPVAYKVLVF